MYFVVGNILEIIYKKYMSYNTLQDDLKKNITNKLLACVRIVLMSFLWLVLCSKCLTGKRTIN